MTQQVALGLTVGLNTLTGLQFDPGRPYTFCCLCGSIFQHPDEQSRKDWSYKHAKTHTDREHNSLRMSGRFMTPDAAIKLASFGVIPMLVDDEIEQALFESKPIPTDDAEG